eukprot:TRINITY_DN59346_c0_g1_i1.p1 TRINITY_DN59346_c0_g1~~TRINITY_DN59346_c0_g1_i1.p1  ORF type:complete len:165 (-),score=35.05 TRINITY_DN59346_c0_g1_i1:29-523(-)
MFFLRISKKGPAPDVQRKVSRPRQLDKVDPAIDRTLPAPSPDDSGDEMPCPSSAGAAFDVQSLTTQSTHASSRQSSKRVFEDEDDDRSDDEEPKRTTTVQTEASEADDGDDVLSLDSGVSGPPPSRLVGHDVGVDHDGSVSSRAVMELSLVKYGQRETRSRFAL